MPHIISHAATFVPGVYAVEVTGNCLASFFPSLLSYLSSYLSYLYRTPPSFPQVIFRRLFKTCWRKDRYRTGRITPIDVLIG
jgi:hypothetical protein